MHIKEPVNSNSLFWFLNDFDTLLNSDCHISFLAYGEFLKGKHAKAIPSITFFLAVWLAETHRSWSAPTSSRERKSNSATQELVILAGRKGKKKSLISHSTSDGVCACVCVCVCARMCAQSLSRFRLFVTPRTVIHQASLSIGFSRHECWKGLSFPFPGGHLHPGIEPTPPGLQVDSSPLSHLGRLQWL